MKLNIFRIAEEESINNKYIFGDLTSALSQKESDSIKEFKNWLFNEANVSVNMSESTLSLFLANGVYYNIYEWAIEQSLISGLPQDICLKEKLGKFYKKRTIFDETFEDGKNFRYGALNAGGIGVEKFGYLCIVLSNEFQNKADIAYLSYDSLEFFNNSDELEINKLRINIADKQHFQELAAKKYYKEIPKLPKSEWPYLLCSKDQYIEAIFTEKIKIKSIFIVRINQKRYDELSNLAFMDSGETLAASDKSLIFDFIQILKADLEGLIKLEKV